MNRLIRTMIPVFLSLVGVVSAAAPSIPEAFTEQRVSTIDGTRIDFADGWVHVRASNTEPIARIMAEAEDRAVAEALIARVRKASGL